VQNHDEKVTDMIRSVLPSTARHGVRATRRQIHRRVRRTMKIRLRAGDHEVVVDIRGALDEMVWDRRAADKEAPLVRWALHHVRTDPALRDASTAERLDHFRQLLPDSTIGRHALSHIAWPLKHLERPHRPRSHGWRPQTIAPTVRALYEAGYNAELNKRLKINHLPILAGLHDVDRFAERAGTATCAVVAALAAEVGLARTTPPDPDGHNARR
jgi:hypothetical protein